MPTATELVAQGYHGYQGWGNAEAAADFAATQGSGKGGPSSADQVTPFLNSYQSNIFSSSGSPEVRDPYLQGLISTYAPNLAGGAGGGFSYTVPKELAG